jgi:hypothetical protein
MYRGQDMENTPSRQIELRLFNYFINNLDNKVEAPDFCLPASFRAVIPKLAFESRFLMEAFLSMCAADMRLESQFEQRRLATISHLYMGRAIAGQAARLRTIDVIAVKDHDFQAVYTTSILIAIHSVIQHQFLPYDADAVDDLGPCVAQWLRAFRGVRTLAATIPQAFASSTLAARFPPGGWQNPFSPEFVPSNDHAVFDFLLADHDMADTRYPAYRHAVAYMGTIYQQPWRQLYTRFLSEVRPQFLASVEQGDHLALLIMAVYLSMTALLKPAVTIVDNSAYRDMRAIARHLSRDHTLLLGRAIAIVKAHPLCYSASSILGVA